MPILEPKWFELTPTTFAFPLPNGVIIKNVLGGNMLADITPALAMVFVPGLEIHEGKLQLISREREAIDLFHEVSNG